MFWIKLIFFEDNGKYYQAWIYIPMQCFIISISINHRIKVILKPSYINVIICTDIQRDDRKKAFCIFYNTISTCFTQFYFIYEDNNTSPSHIMSIKGHHRAPYFTIIDITWWTNPITVLTAQCCCYILKFEN